MGVPVPRHIVGTAKADRLVGGDLNDTLEGRGGDDRLFGSEASDTLLGGPGDDILVGGFGLDAMLGGPGDDHYDVEESDDQVIEAPNDGVDTVVSSLSFALPENVENMIVFGLGGIGNELDNRITGDSGDQSLSGRAGDDTLKGGSGDDVLAGGGGDDKLSGGAGADRLDGGAGGNRLAGGAGNDTYVVRTLGDVVIESDGAGTDKVLAAVSYRLPDHVERLVLTGKAGTSGTGNDLDNVLRGNGASNLLRGGGGGDTVDGGAGNDSLSGGGGGDSLKGGGGQDRMEGGGGDDLYFVDSANDKVIEAPGEGVDTVRSSATFALKANVENLALTGTGEIDGTGNGLDNEITGNSAGNVLADRRHQLLGHRRGLRRHQSRRQHEPRRQPRQLRVLDRRRHALLRR